MSVKWAIEKALTDKAIEAVREVGEVIDDLEEKWNERTERWQDTDRGQAVYEWIHNARTLVERAEEQIEGIQTLHIES